MTAIKKKRAKASARHFDATRHKRATTIHVSEVSCLQITRTMSYCLGTAFEYVWHAGEGAKRLDRLRGALFYAEQAHEAPAIARPQDGVKLLAQFLEHEDRFAIREALSSLLIADTTPSDDERGLFTDMACGHIRALIDQAAVPDLVAIEREAANAEPDLEEVE